MNKQNRKLALNRETIQALTEQQLEGQVGASTPSIVVSLVVTQLLTCGFFCGPQQAR